MPHTSDREIPAVTAFAAEPLAPLDILFNALAAPASRISRTPHPRGNSSAIALLLEYGADLGLEQGNGRAIACEAAARGHREVLKLLLAPHDPPESIGGNVSTTLQNGHGRTVLMEAAMQGHAECLKVVIEAGADLDFATKNYNATAAHFAARDSHLECLNILRDAGADMEIERTDGKTAMQIHRENVRTQMTNALLRSAPKKSDSGFKV